MNLNRSLILLLACLEAQIALADPSLAEKNAAENAAIKKEWESWNAPFKPFRLIGNIHFWGASLPTSSTHNPCPDPAPTVLVDAAECTSPEPVVREIRL